MSLLDRALNFAEKAYNYVVGKDNESKPVSAKGKTPQKVNSVTNSEGKTVGTVGDSFEKTKAKKTQNTSKTVKAVSVPEKSLKKEYSSGTKSSKSVQNAINKVKASIQQKCQKFGISYKEAESTILAQMDFSYEEFKNASPEEQLADLCCIDGALGLYIFDNKKRKVHSTVDKASVIGQTAKNIKDIKEFGGIEDVNEFNKKVGDVNKEVDGKVSENTSDEEYANILEESRRNLKASVELERIAEIKKCRGNKDKIAEVNARYEKRLQIFEKQRQTDFVTAHGARKAHLSIYLRSGNDFSDAHKTALDLFDGKQKTVVADSFSHDFEMNARRRYYLRGERISADEYAKAVKQTTQYMSERALCKFQQDAHDFRVKVEKGELSAPYMTEEDFQKETVAIGVGITNNKNLSSEAKAELLDKWDRNARDFSDYCDVKAEYNRIVNAEVSGNVLKTQEVKNIRNILIKKYSNDTETLPRSWEKRRQQNPEVKPKANEATLKAVLKTKSVTEVKRTYSNSMHELAGIVLKNDIEYKNRIDDILDYLKCFSGTDIGIKIAGCSTSTISKIIQKFPDKSEDILDVVAPTMCFSGKKAVERIVEERQEHAAA